MPITVINGIPNEEQLAKIAIGAETILGTKGTIDHKLYGKMAVNKQRPLADRDEFAGTWFGDYTPVYGAVVIDGTYEQPLTYEDGPNLGRYCIVSPPAPTDDGNTVHGYTYALKPSPTARMDIDYFSAELGVPGMPWELLGAHFPSVTISGDIDDSEAAWKWSSPVLAFSKEMIAATTGVATGGSTTTIVKSGAGWTTNQFAGAWARLTGGTAGNIGQVREVLSNNATTLTLNGDLPGAVANTDTFEISGVFTPSIPDRTRNTIDAPGTIVYVDTGTIGTTPREGTISFAVTFARNSYGKRFLKDRNGFSRYGRKKFRVNGQLRIEFDTRAEYDQWTNQQDVKIRIAQTGPTIDSGAGSKMAATIDVPKARWDNMTPETRESNLTAMMQFRGFVDVGGINAPGQMSFKNTLSALL